MHFKDRKIPSKLRGHKCNNCLNVWRITNMFTSLELYVSQQLFRIYFGLILNLLSYLTLFLLFCWRITRIKLISIKYHCLIWLESLQRSWHILMVLFFWRMKNRTTLLGFYKCLLIFWSLKTISYRWLWLTEIPHWWTLLPQNKELNNRKSDYMPIFGSKARFKLHQRWFAPSTQ